MKKSDMKTALPSDTIPRGVVFAPGGAVILLGSMVMLGWWMDITAFKSVLPGIISMKFNTAFGFIASGLALTMMAKSRTAPPARAIVCLVMALGALTLSQYLFGWDLGIDQILYREPTNTIFTPHPGRMSPVTAVSFILVAASLLLISYQRLVLLVQSMVFFIGVFAGLILAAYLFGQPRFPNFPNFTPMAAHTALGFLSLMVGMMSMTIDQGILRRLHHQLTTIAFTFALALLLVSGGAIYYNIEGTIKANASLKQAFQSMMKLEEATTNLNEMVATLRAYMLTGDENSVVKLDQAKNSFITSLTDAKTQLAYDRDILHRLEQMQPLVQQRLDLVRTSISLRREHGEDVKSMATATLAGEKTTQEILEQIQSIQDTQEALIKSEQAGVVSHNNSTYAALVFTGLTGIILMLMVFLSLRRQISIREAAEIELTHTNQVLAESQEKLVRQERLAAAEEQQRASALYTRSLIEASLDPLVTISKDGKVMDVNRATEEVTGLAREQLIGTDFSDYFTEPDQARAGYQQVFSQGFVTDYPLAIRHASGKVTDVLYNATVYRDAKGEVAGVFAAARDVTEIKKVESELRQANTDLESFSYSVSHDLRAPLRAIDGFSAILRDEYAAKLDAEGLRLFQVVSDNAKKMGKLIEDILFLSRANRHEMQLNPVDMKELAQEVWNSLDTDRLTRQIEFRLADMPAACADTSAIREVLQNLLGNAIKFTRGREPAIIEMVGHRKGLENVYSVHDNGTGFDMAFSNKLFGLFSRLHSMTEFEGTGVGLAIVKRFVTKHGGRVWAEGKLGEGATFWFTLPPATNCNQPEESNHE